MKLINILKQHYISTEHVACHTLQSDKMYRLVGPFFLVDFNRNFISLHTLPPYLTLFLYASLFVDIVAVAQ